MEQRNKRILEKTSPSVEIVRASQPVHLVSHVTSQRKWIPNFSEAKLLLIASTGFFIDAYDLFTINLVVPLLNIEYNGKLGSKLGNAALAGGVLKAATNIGCIFGQVLFGTLGDIYGRKIVYPAALGVAIMGTVLTIAAPNSLGASGVFIWMTIMRILMGIGIGEIIQCLPVWFRIEPTSVGEVYCLLLPLQCKDGGISRGRWFRLWY